jgi:3-hydroxyacyl-CoA dehydrogenase/enoyl-CoA hydratase/carnithine racemase
MPQRSAIIVSDIDSDIALVTIDQVAGANALSESFLPEFDKTFESLAKRTDLTGVVLTSNNADFFLADAEATFIAQHADWSDQKITRYCEFGRAAMARLSRCPFVTVAAVNQHCQGAGLELALWCDYRVAVADADVLIGLPAVQLGLVPGWAGTARLSRIAGLADAADLITSGRLIGTDIAHEMGIVDIVTSGGRLMQEAVDLIHRVHTSGAFIEQRKSIMGPVQGVTPQTWQEVAEPILESVATTVVANQHEIFPFAPTVAIEHLTRTCVMSMQAAWISESVAMTQVWGSPANRGLLHYHNAVDFNRSNPGLVDQSASTIDFKTIGIVGAGLMGRSIAAICLAAGINVVLLDADQSVAKQAAGGLTAGPANVAVAESYADFANCELVIESVVETLPVKKIVLEKIEAAVPTETIIATNTSAIPIEKLAATLKHPERFCGIHFCHPELMSLVEVICGRQSNEATIAAGVRFVQQIEKMPIAMNDSPGFVVNRLLAAMLNQSIILFIEGVEISAIDEAMREFGFLGGPFEIIDVIGVDTCMYAGRTMWEAGLDCVSLSPILPKLMKLKRLGRKSGLGFYAYESTSQASNEDDLANLLGGYRNDVPTAAELPSEAIQQRILTAVAAEAKKILSAGIVADARDIDLCIVNGFSFPRHQGGILHWSAANPE